jgi:hypothetical protein
VDVTSHRRAWMRRAGVVVALVAGALVAVPASPAVAADPEVQITGLSSGTLTSGERAQLTFKVVNKNEKPPGSDTANIKVTSSFGELTCEGQCDFNDQVPREGEKEFTATLVARNVPEGETRSGKIEIRAEINNEAGTAERDVTVRGPQKQQPETVKEISGRVTDISTGEAIAGAFVAISDSAEHRYDTITDRDGRYTFTGSTEKPITPGEIQIGAQKEDVRVFKTINVGAGKSLTGYRLVLRLSAPAPTTSPSSAAAPTPSAEPTLPTAEPTEAAAAAPGPATTEEGSGGFGSLLLLLLGGLLVALGVGAIVLLWLRRKDNAGDDDDEPIAVAPGGGPVRPVYGGMSNPTNFAGPGPAAPTMAAGMGVSDAPTMLQNRPMIDDEFPDPYGAPLMPPQPPTYPGRPAWDDGYGEPGTQAGYGPPQGRPSSGGGFGAAPSSGGGHGSPAGAAGAAAGYGAAQAGGWGRDPGYDDRYDEPTGRFRAGDEARYGPGGHEREAYGDGEPGFGHSQRRGDAGGYPGQDDYRAVNGYDDRGYDDRGGYDDRAGYNGQTGYEQHGGYGETRHGDERGGYDQRGYDRVPEQRDAEYDNHGYGPGSGYPDDPGAQRRRGGSPPPRRSERRSADWLDD